MEKPNLPKGTRDFGPAQMAKRQFIFETVKKVFQTYGFQPLETPSMENLATLQGKYGEEGDQLLFKVLNSGDFLKDVEASKLETRNSKLVTFDIAEKGLRYDLTVPFARYVVMNKGEITFPFKRYQIQPVWRADRPQKGRYREFYQCDADVVGTDSLICEAEIILMIKDVFKRLGIQDYSIKVNHRGILSGLAELANAKESESSLFVAIDKLEKIGEEKVKEELAAKGFDQNSLNTVFEILNFSGSTQQKIDFLADKFARSTIGQEGLADFIEVLNLLANYGDAEDHVEFDFSLARGLSYYTGCIFEVKINNVAIGSVSGGGRYDNLTAMFDDKEKLSGVGFSFGVDRLYDAMEELETKEKRNLFPEGSLVSSHVLICHIDKQSMLKGLAVLHQLRQAGIASEIYPDEAKAKKPLEKPLQYALKKSIPFAVVVDSAESALSLKTLKTGEQEKLSLETIIERLKTSRYL